MTIQVIAAEAGGTHLRGVLLEVQHDIIRCLATAHAPGANPNVVGLDAAVRAWRHVLATLKHAASDPEAVRGALSCAGNTSAASIAWEAELSCIPTLMHDTEAPAWAVSETGSATVLIAGTGSMASVLHNGAVLRQVGGRGWWLGDEGSAVWIGRELIRLALDDLDANVDSPLLQHCATLLDVSTLSHADIYAAIYQPADGSAQERANVATSTGRFAPLVETCTDPRVELVATAAAQHLLALLHEVVPAGPVVLTGSVANGRVGTLVAQGCTEEPIIEPDGLTGAAMRALDAMGFNHSPLLHAKVAPVINAARASLR